MMQHLDLWANNLSTHALASPEKNCRPWAAMELQALRRTPITFTTHFPRTRANLIWTLSNIDLAYNQYTSWTALDGKKSANHKFCSLLLKQKRSIDKSIAHVTVRWTLCQISAKLYPVASHWPDRAEALESGRAAPIGKQLTEHLQMPTQVYERRQHIN